VYVRRRRVYVCRYRVYLILGIDKIFGARAAIVGRPSV